MKAIQRIAIIGNAGSGKSFLANKLQSLLKLPVYHLDQYYWKPSWVRQDPDVYKKIHDKLCDQDSWIIDGINRTVFEYRFQRADIIIFLDIPKYLCIWRIIKRTFAYYGKLTPSSAEGCAERFNTKFFHFLKWVWRFDKKYPPLIKSLMEKYPSKRTYILKSKKEVDTFLENIVPQWI